MMYRYCQSVLSRTFLVIVSLFLAQHALLNASDEILFLLRTHGLELENGAIFLAGEGFPVGVSFDNRFGEEGYCCFYRLNGTLTPGGIFEGGFDTAVSHGNTIFVLEDENGFLRFMYKKGMITYEDYIAAPEQFLLLKPAVYKKRLYFLCRIEDTSEAGFLVLENGTLIQSKQFAGFDFPENSIDVRFIFTPDGPFISWRNTKTPGIGCRMWKEGVWKDSEFRNARVNSYDISGDRRIYFAEKENLNRENVISYSRFTENGWSGTVPVRGSETGFAEKYESISVTGLTNGDKLIVRSHYTPFGAFGTDVFREKNGRWDTEYKGVVLVYFTLLAAAGALVVLATISVLIRRWFPFMIYRRYQSIQLGSLFSRALGVFIDSVIVGVISFGIVGLFRIQDMSTTEYTYVSQILFFSLFYVYGLVGEFFTGRTFGKFVLGLNLRNNIGMKCGLREIMIRNLLKVFELQMPIIPAITILFTEKNQRLGDLLAGTRVQKWER